MVDINGIANDYSYDLKGNLLTTTAWLPTGARTATTVYDNNRQPTDIILPSGRVTRYRYNTGGRLDRVGNGLGEYVQLPFDVPANTASSRAARNTPAVAGSALVANSAGDFVTTTQLDSLGRTWKMVGENGQRTTLGYDRNGNLKSRADALGRTTYYNYDDLNRVTSVTMPDGGVTRPFVVSCGTRQSELAIVVEPGGHVGRLRLSLSTCPRGGCQEHGFEHWSGSAVHQRVGSATAVGG